MKKYNLLEDKTIVVNDQNVDYLNNMVYVEELHRVISSTIETSYTETIGLFGSWGSGKSSIIKSVVNEYKNEMSKDNNKKKVEFHFYDAWKYSSYDFRDTFLFDVAKDSKSDMKRLEQKLYIKKTESSYTFDKWRTGIIFLFSIIMVFLLTRFIDFDNLINEPVDTIITLVLLVVVEVVLIQISNIIFKQSSESSEKKFSQHDYHSEFSKLVKNDKKTRVFIIDNLDRCTEEYSIEILDFIKGFLSKETGNYIFVIPIDEERIVQELISRRSYSWVEAKDFLSKVFDVSVVMHSYPSINTYKLSKSISEENEFGFSNITLNLISQYYGITPRRIKKIMNLINSKREIIEDLHLKNDNECKDENYIDVITKVVIIREKWPKLFKSIEHKPSLLSELSNVGNEVLKMEDDDELTRFLKETRDVTTIFPEIYINNTYDDFSFNEDDKLLIRSGDIERLITNLSNREDANSLAITVGREYFEYVHNRDGLYEREFFITLNSLYKFLYDESIQEEVIIDSIQESYKKISIKPNEFFQNEEFEKLLLDHIGTIINNSLTNDAMSISFVKIIKKWIELGISSLLLKAILTEYESVKKLDDSFPIEMFKAYSISGDEQFSNQIESTMEKLATDVDDSLLQFLIDNKKVRYLSKFYELNHSLFANVHDKYNQLILNTAAEYRSVSYTNLETYIYRFEAISNVINYGEKDSVKVLMQKLLSMGVQQDCYRLLTQYTDDELNFKYIGYINSIFFELFKLNNFVMNGHFTHYINYIFAPGNATKFYNLIYQYVNIEKDINTKERVYISQLITSNFSNTDFLQEYILFYNETFEEVSMEFIRDIIISTTNSVNSSLSFISQNANVAPIIDFVIDEVSKLNENALLKILESITLSDLAVNVNIQGLANISNLYKRVFINKTTNYNDLSICVNSLNINGIKRNINEKLYEYIPNMTHPEIKLLDKNDKFEINRKIQNLAINRIEELKIVFEDDEYERISK